MVSGWSHVEEEHCFIPYSELGTRNIVALCPCVGFALNKDFVLGAAEIKGVCFFAINSDRDNS